MGLSDFDPIILENAAVLGDEVLCLGGVGGGECKMAGARKGRKRIYLEGMSKMKPGRGVGQRPGKRTYILAIGYWAETIFKSDSTVPSCFSVAA